MWTGPAKPSIYNLIKPMTYETMKLAVTSKI